jgi:hypothetical protein
MFIDMCRPPIPFLLAAASLCAMSKRDRFVIYGRGERIGLAVLHAAKDDFKGAL